MSEFWTGSLKPRPSSDPARAIASITTLTASAVRIVNVPSRMPAMTMRRIRLKRSPQNPIGSARISAPTNPNATTVRTPWVLSPKSSRMLGNSTPNA